MIDQTPKTDNTSPTLVPTVIWAALLLSQFMYVALSFQIAGKRDAEGLGVASGTSLLFKPLAAVAVLVFVIAILLPQVLWKKLGTKVDAETASLQSLTTPFFAPFIIRLAMLEAVTLFGFILVIAGKEPVQTLFPFLGAAILGFILSFPSAGKIRSVFKSSGPTQI